MLYDLMLGIFLSAMGTWLTALATTIGVLTGVILVMFPAFAVKRLFK